MKARYAKELNKVHLNVEINTQYEEDYQLIMMQRNQIPGLLKVDYFNVDGKSRFVYDVSGMKSMKRRYETQQLKGRDILKFVEMLLQTVNEIRKYMLYPDHLILDPAFIFYQEGRWYFLYLPVKRTSMDKAFHELTEYFVKTLDYSEKEGIQLAYELHKETMQENYNLEQIMAKYDRNQETGEIANSSEENTLKQATGNIFVIDDGEYKTIPDAQAIREKNDGFHPFRMIGDRFRRSRWGNWEDLILEADRQDD